MNNPIRDPYPRLPGASVEVASAADPSDSSVPPRRSIGAPTSPPHTRRLFPLRVALLTLWGAAMGIALMACSASALPADTLTETVARHLGAPNGDLWLRWLYLFAEGLPPLLLLSLSGLTFFSGAVTTGVLPLYAAAEGASLTLLYLMAKGSIPSPAHVPMPRLLLCYGLLTLLRWVLRAVMAVATRRTADRLAPGDTRFPKGCRCAPALMPHLTVTVGVCLGYAALCLGYVLLTRAG